MITGEQIRAARDALGETQTVFAARFGVDQATVHRWETRGLPENGTARVAVEQFVKAEAEQAAP